MENCRWIVVVGMFVLALMLAACGPGDATEGGNDPGDDGVTDDVGPSDDSNPDDTAPQCGNGTCEEGEGCSSCVNDCACTEQYTACRNDACVDWDTINPLLKKLPGRWIRLEPEWYEANVNVDVDRPTCEVDGYPQGDPGDACVQGFSPFPFTISGQNLSYRSYDTTAYAEGQVLNDGTRVEATIMDTYDTSISIRLVYEKQ